ncbi:hypothetical protein J2W14_004174 [Pseudarthrobacter oxydans]|nr:hypothetical protein [Pseudarthrobacter oxydans]MDP9984747.1 hypothetical protein [Pseudarthrobacter oxydans]
MNRTTVRREQAEGAPHDAGDQASPEEAQYPATTGAATDRSKDEL